MKTDCEFKTQHQGHPVSLTTGFTTNGTGQANCLLCEVEEVVEVTHKICQHHKYGKHIKIKCEKCGVEGTTKNIGYVGARSLFISCSHSIDFMKHTC